MHDLRKKVLVQSGKTKSRKAQAREELPRSSESTDASVSPKRSPRTSPSSSLAGSRANSRPGSRYASEEEADPNDMAAEYGEFKYEFDPDESDDDDEEAAWVNRLRTRIGNLPELRKAGYAERELALAGYLHLVRQNYAQAEIEGSLKNIILPALVGCIERGKSSMEVVTALNALSATLINCPDGSAYERTGKVLERIVEDSADVKVKVAGMNALAVALAFGGGGEPETQELLEFLLSIIESDGQSVGAEDSGVAVTGALRAWGFVASYLDDLGESTEDGRAMEAFLEQLDSTDADVQIYAGYNIAHLFEAARNLEKSSGVEASGLQHNQHLALTRMHEIVKFWTKSISKKDRRLLRDEFPAIILSIENDVGPGYTTNELLVNNDPEKPDPASYYKHLPDYSRLGIRKKDRSIRTHGPEFIIDDWKCHSRLEVLRMVLLGGMEVHWQVNPEVKAALKRNWNRDWKAQRSGGSEEEEED